MSATFVLRLINALLAGGVAGLCFLKFDFDHRMRVRNTRIAGLGVICTAIAWGSFGLRNDDFHPWTPVATVGLILAFYGMRRLATGETDKRKVP